MRVMRVPASVFAVVLGLVAACGSSDESGDPKGSGGADGGAGSAGSSAGGAGGAGGGGAGGAGGSSASGGSGGSSASGGSGGSSAGGTGGSAGVDGGAGQSGSSGTDGGAGSAGAGGSAGGDGGKLTAAQCFAGWFVNPGTLGPDYDQFNPVIGSHCKGTNHQNIQGIERVVFLGDSITVGTPPTNLNPANVYRAILSKNLAPLLGVQAPGFGWGGADPFNGVALPKSSGAFTSCAKWGARADDLMKDSNQVVDCIPQNERNKKHLVIMTVGGNDIAAITQDGGGANPVKTIPELWADTQAFVQLVRETVEWLKDPVNVPGGVDVVFANMYEFTDGTGDTKSCTTASLGGIEPWQDKQAQADMVIWANEQYMKIAVDTQSDMIFMLESFCGHGFKRNDATGPCYRGPNQPLWFDLTCIHPSDAGHVAAADLFFDTIAE